LWLVVIIIVAILLEKLIYDFFLNCFDKRNIFDKIFPSSKRMLPFERISPQKILAPNIIDGQIFEFLISRYADIQLISK